MTGKMYYKDSFLQEFKANINSVIEKDDKYHIVLDQTAFYPEGGGQPADKGLIGQKKVTYVYEKDEVIYHVLNQIPEKKKELNCKIDWKRRFDFMQQHSGQHLLSAVLKDMYKANTVGFHLSSNSLTIDIDSELSSEEFELVENRVNKIIYQDREINAEYPDPEELKSMSLRKEPSVAEDIRVVEIKGIDYSPCGGIHLSSTGQIGIVSILNTDNYKEGMRITFLCGRRAVEDYKYKNKIVAEARDILSVSNDLINSSIKKLKNDLNEKSSKIQDLKEELVDYRVHNLMEQTEKKSGLRIIKKIYISKDFSDLKYTVKKLIGYDNNIVIFGQRDSNTVRIIMAKSANIDKLNMGDLLRDVMSSFNGNGGGSDHFAQGGGSVSNPEQIIEIVNMAYEKVNDCL